MEAEAGAVGSGKSQPNYVMGAVVNKARSVRVDFFDRKPLLLATIPAPRTLGSRIRFFVASCPTRRTRRPSLRATQRAASLPTTLAETAYRSGRAELLIGA